jgi:protein-tyrosine phosphatase
MNTKYKVSVLFVCMGNICRSPTGEGVFQYYVEQQGHADKIHIDSAGTIAYHQGELADARMREVAAKRNYQLNSIARKTVAQDIEMFDLIVAMDHDNLYELEALAGGKQDHIRLLGSFINDYTNESAPSVPDPYYGGLAGFEQVLDMIESACPNMLTHCLELVEKKNS